METKPKTHYRAVMKSDHLGVADLEDFIEQKVELKFTIKEVKQEIGVKVAGKKGNHNVCYFTNSAVKPWVLNAGNSKTLKMLTGSSFIEDWKGVTVELFIDENVQFAGQATGGVRIKPLKFTKNKLTVGTKAYENAVSHLKKNGTIDDIKIHYDLTEEVEKQLKADSL